MGVIGRSCTACPNPYAEVTLRGCEVVYDGCPRSFSQGLWWPRTKFGVTSIEECPDPAEGRTSRSCDDKLGGWQEPDVFNCTSQSFVEQRRQLAALETNELQLNTYVAIKIASDLHRAVNETRSMYGADVLIAESLLKFLLDYEESLSGLNLTHSQDKDYVGHLVNVASAVLRKDHKENWDRIKVLTGQGPENVSSKMALYLKTLTSSQHDTFTNPFEVVNPNIGEDITNIFFCL